MTIRRLFLGLVHCLGYLCWDPAFALPCVCHGRGNGSNLGANARAHVASMVLVHPFWRNGKCVEIPQRIHVVQKSRC